MKKIFFLAMMAMVAFTAVSCQQDDDFNNVKKATLTTKLGDNTNTNYTSVKANNPNAFTISVLFTGYSGASNKGTDTQKEAYETVRNYYKELLGQNVTVTAIDDYNLGFEIKGEKIKDSVTNKIKNDTNTQKLRDALEKITLLRSLDFKVYNSGETVLLFEYSKKTVYSND